MPSPAGETPGTEPSDHGTTLVLDVSQGRVWTGVLGEDRWLAVVEDRGEPLVAIAPSVAEALAAAGKQWDDVTDCLYCEGPGTTLGLRLAAMSIETWRAVGGLRVDRVWTYSCLDLVAENRLEAGEATFSVVTAVQRGAVEGVEVHEGRRGALTTFDVEGFAGVSPVYGLAVARPGLALPAGAQVIPYSPVPLAQPRIRRAVGREGATARPLAARQVGYARWGGERHRRSATANEIST